MTNFMAERFPSAVLALGSLGTESDWRCQYNKDIRCLFKRFTFARRRKKFAACPVVKINIIKFCSISTRRGSEREIEWEKERERKKGS